MLWRELDVLEYPHPMASHDEEKELAMLRESIRDMEAGLGQPFENAMDEILIDFKAQRQSQGKQAMAHTLILRPKAYV